jgi:hypothetical protein
MIVSWKLESRKSLRENKLLSSSTPKLDRWIMLLMLQRFIEIVNDFELSHRFMALNYFSITGDKSSEPQKVILDDDLLSFLLFSLSSCLLMTLEIPLLGLFLAWTFL